MYHWFISVYKSKLGLFDRIHYKRFSEVSPNVRRRYCQGFGLIAGMLVLSLLIASVLTTGTSAIAYILKTNANLNIPIDTIEFGTSSLPPATKPLRPPRHTPDNYQPSPSPRVTHQNETEYLLEREHLLPIYPRLLNRVVWRTKVKTAQPRNDWNALGTAIHVRSGVTPPNIREQIPRPPPQSLKRKRNTRRRHYDELENPRPFNFPLDGPAPAEFKKIHPSMYESLGSGVSGSDRMNNIQDILRYLHLRDKERLKLRRMRNHAIQFSGQYRHLKSDTLGDILKSLQRKPIEMSAKAHRTSGQLPTDPLYPYKPKSANEVNLLAIQQQAMMRGKKVPHFYTPSVDIEEEYRKAVLQHKYRPIYGGDPDFDRPHNMTKPLKLLLDIYPAESGSRPSIVDSQKTKSKKKKAYSSPLLPLPMLDASYYNSINFPQLHQTKYPQASNFYQNTFLHNKISEPESHTEAGQSGQILLHLNVFPKEKAGKENEDNLAKSMPENGYDILTEGFDDRSTSTAMSKQGKDLKLGNVGHSFAKPTESGNASFEEPIVVDEQKDVDDFPLFREVSENVANSTGARITSGVTMTDQNATSHFRMPAEDMLKFHVNDAL